MSFTEKLADISRKNRSLLCIGLDPDHKLMPENVSVFDFNKAIIDATADLVCAYKPNFAFYEAMGNEGLETLKRTVEYIPKTIPVIADAKRGDIGNTAKAYAEAIFSHYDFDAVTVSPYLGLDSLEPFFEYKDRCSFVLCRTSNPGAVDFQSLLCEADGRKLPLYQAVALKARRWNKYGNIGLVVGATYPQELKTIRQSCPDMPLLIPGVGTQGGDLATTIRFGVDADGGNAVINSSRQVLYASREKTFAVDARRVAAGIRDQMIHELAAISR